MSGANGVQGTAAVGLPGSHAERCILVWVPARSLQKPETARGRPRRASPTTHLRAADRHHPPCGIHWTAIFARISSRSACPGDNMKSWARKSVTRQRSSACARRARPPLPPTRRRQGGAACRPAANSPRRPGAPPFEEKAHTSPPTAKRGRSAPAGASPRALAEPPTPVSPTMSALAAASRCAATVHASRARKNAGEGRAAAPGQAGGRREEAAGGRQRPRPLGAWAREQRARTEHAADRPLLPQEWCWPPRLRRAASSPSAR